MPLRHLLPPLVAVVTVIGVAAVITILAAPEAVRAAPAAASSDVGVQVDAVGTATGTPDILRVTIGVETTADATEAALQDADVVGPPPSGLAACPERSRERRPHGQRVGSSSPR